MLSFIDLLGLQMKDLQWYQMLTRTFIVFIAALAFIRLSGMRTFGTSSAFDVVVSISLGAIMGKCIMGHYPFFPGLLAAGFLVCLHRLTAWLAARSALFRKVTEGDPVILFGNGVVKEDARKKYNITGTEITAAMHDQGMDDVAKVKTIWLEPDGSIRVVKEN